MTLRDDIDARRREIHTDGYSMSIGEIISMYKDGDLDIHPEFQRIFRWSDEQKSRLIESILLGIPIPTIFVSQRDDGVWDVIDGVQRLSTILQFAGLYRDEANVLSAPLRLGATEYLPALEGIAYGSEGEQAAAAHAFDEVLRRDFKRAKFDFVIVKKESDTAAKYDLFQRLNSGTELSAQEARNCLLVMLDRTFYEWVGTITRMDSFQETTLLSPRQEDEGFREELVLRAILHNRYEGGATELKKEHGEFLTDWMRALATDTSFDRQAEYARLKGLFGVLTSALEENAFRRWDPSKARFLGPFSISAFEAITAGVGRHLDWWTGQPPELLVQRVKALWSSQAFRDSSGSGVSPRRRMPKLVALGRDHFAPDPE